MISVEKPVCSSTMSPFSITTLSASSTRCSVAASISLRSSPKCLCRSTSTARPWIALTAKFSMPSASAHDGPSHGSPMNW